MGGRGREREGGGTRDGEESVLVLGDGFFNDLYHLFLFLFILAIMEEYEDVIASNFFGHVHYDEFRVFNYNKVSLPLPLSSSPYLHKYKYFLTLLSLFPTD